MKEYLFEIIDIKAQMNQDFLPDERNLLSVGFRNYIGVLQSSIRVLAAINVNKKYKKYERNLPDFLKDL